MSRYGPYGSGGYGSGGYRGGEYEEYSSGGYGTGAYESRGRRRSPTRSYSFDYDYFFIPQTHPSGRPYDNNSNSYYADEPRGRARSRSRQRSYPSSYGVPRHSSQYPSWDNRPPPRPSSPPRYSYGSDPYADMPPRRSDPEPSEQVPYTYEEEEPSRIPHVAAAWNNYTTSSTREELIAFFVRQGLPRGRVEREISREFAAHAPQHRAGQLRPGPSRYSEARARSNNPRARSRSPRRDWGWRSPPRERSESPPAFWYRQPPGSSSGFY